MSASFSSLARKRLQYSPFSLVSVVPSNVGEEKEEEELTAQLILPS